MYTPRARFSVSHYCKHPATVCMNCTHSCSTEHSKNQFLSPPKQNKTKPNPNKTKLFYTEELQWITGMRYFSVALLTSSEGNSSSHTPECPLEIFLKGMYFVCLTVLDFSILTADWNPLLYFSNDTKTRKSFTLKWL